MKNIFWLLRYFALIIMLCACQKGPDAPLPVLRIGYSAHDHHAPLYIAAMNPDYFRQNGDLYLKEIRFRQEYELIAHGKLAARVLLASSEGGQELIRKLKEDQFDLAFGGIPAMIHFIDQKAPLKIVAPVMTDGDGLVVRNDLPVGNWDQFIALLRNRKQPLRIGYKLDISVQNLIFEYALREEKISFSKDLRQQNVQVLLCNLQGAKNLIPALKNGLIDGFVVNQPIIAQAEYEKAGKEIAALGELPPHGKWHGTPCCALAARNDSLETSPEVTTRMITLLLRANRFITEHPDRAAPQIASWLGIPVEVESRSIATIHYTTEFDQSWELGVSFWIDSMLERGMLQGDIKKSKDQNALSRSIYNLNIYQRARKEL